jgi:hypothetical protein
VTGIAVGIQKSTIARRIHATVALKRSQIFQERKWSVEQLFDREQEIQGLECRRTQRQIVATPVKALKALVEPK